MKLNTNQFLLSYIFHMVDIAVTIEKAEFLVDIDEVKGNHLCPPILNRRGKHGPILKTPNRLQ